MELVIAWLIFAAIVGVGASARGRSGFGWFFLSCLISPLLSLILLLLLPKRTAQALSETVTPATHRKCPQCAELILREARKCKHCGSAVQPEPLPSTNTPKSKSVVASGPELETEVLETEVIGVTDDNVDGGSRQLLVRDLCRPNGLVELVREQHGALGKVRFAVYAIHIGVLGTKRGQIGYLSDDVADRLGGIIAEGGSVAARIAEVLDATSDRSTVGVKLKITTGSAVKRN